MANGRISKGRRIARLTLLGLTSAILYALLFAFEQPVLDGSARGGWYFLIPVVTAFVFSIAHGTFTSLFWDVLGIRAKR
ncbi:MAG: hypothetical protein HC807_02125 [Gammaproteobacteria bacterium]|nr:hypothetical protein [Gammaproteobacteria bacterium]